MPRAGGMNLVKMAAARARQGGREPDRNRYGRRKMAEDSTRGQNLRQRQGGRQRVGSILSDTLGAG